MGQTNYSTGHEAERHAAKYLKKQGFKVHALNWRTPVCEIDIVAEKRNVKYFVEVKHRKNHLQGSGVDYITLKKLKQMQFAANCWVAENDWHHDFELAVVEVSGEDFKITNCLLDIF